MQQARRDTYHHGDAKNALLLTAARLLEEVGARQLSLRAIAVQAKLSHQAPYNHFSNKEALLAELVKSGFKQLENSIRSVVGYPDDTLALERAGAAYINFAQSAPALFRIMFSRELVDIRQFPEAEMAADAAFRSLVDIVEAFAPPAHSDDLALSAWCLVHGYATLCIELGLEEKTESGRRARLFAALIKQQVQGDRQGQH